MMRWRVPFPLNGHGQAMVETALLVFLLTAACFAGIQLCLIAADDLTANEAAFAAMRVAAVTPESCLRQAADATVQRLFLPQRLATAANLGSVETRVWDEQIAGKDMPDHQGRSIRKFTTNIDYQTYIMFASLLQPAGLPVSGSRRQTARARLVKSPDEAYYTRAWPGARHFTRNTTHE